MLTRVSLGNTEAGKGWNEGQGEEPALQRPSGDRVRLQSVEGWGRRPPVFQSQFCASPKFYVWRHHNSDFKWVLEGPWGLERAAN
jgi:hypothetical protein